MAKRETIRINRAALIAAVEVCNRDKGLKDTALPVVFTTHKTGLCLRRSVPGGVSARVAIECDGTPDFSVIAWRSRLQLDGANLAKSLRAASGEAVELRVIEKTRAEFKHARGKFTLPLQLEEIMETEFPDEKPPADMGIEFGNARELLNAVRTLSPFIAADDARPNLQGACIRLNAAVATDGHRLSVASFDGAPGPSSHDLLIEGAFAVHALESAGTGPLELTAFKNTLFARGDNWAIARPRLEGTFPNFQQVIPDYSDGSKCAPVTVSARAFAEAISAVEPSASVKTHNVRIEFTESGLTLSAADAEKGESEYQIDATVPAIMTGRKVGFNLKYLRDALRFIPGDSVDLYMPDALSPALVVPQGETNFTAPASALAVVMPMRL
jgi:DNA polymerase III sliding clamp (beta) subunit (PCNA family)